MIITIEPNTTLKLLKNVPLDTTYQNTLYWESSNSGKQAQTNYFNSKVKYSTPANTYQRVNKGVLRYPLNANYLYDCNYCMFQNSYFGYSKWFYAFITKVEYVNENMSEVYYTLDPIQSWYFDFVLNKTFIARSHTTTDPIYTPRPAESRDLGHTSNYSAHTAIHHSDMAYMLVTTSSSIGRQVRRINRTYSGLYTWCTNSLSTLNEKLNKAMSEGDDTVVTIYQYPTDWQPNLDNSYSETQREVSLYYSKVTDFKLSNTLSDYTPRNKILYNYPYNRIVVNNNAGQSAEYHIEDFQNPASGTIQFREWATVYPSPCSQLMPYNYKMLLNNYMDALSLNYNQQVAWKTDTYNTWLVANSNKNAQARVSAINTRNVGIIGGAVTTAIGAGVAVATGLTGAGAVAGVSMMAGGVTSILSSLTQANNTVNELTAQKEDMQAIPDQAGGQIASDSLNGATGKVGYDIYQVTVGRSVLQRLDDYYDRFGYPINAIQTVNLKARPHWTYIQTVGCTVTGSVPAEDMNVICKIHDNGITYWANPNEVGNYSLDNSPQ